MFLSDIAASFLKLLVGLACVFVFSGAALLLQLMLSVLLKRVARPTGEQALSLFLFAFLGWVMGLVMAASREAAVGTVIPAALTLIGGVALFLFTEPRYKKEIVFAAVFGFSAMLLFGTVLGSYERARAIADARSIDRLVRAAQTEFLVDAFRKSRGLPPLAGMQGDGDTKDK